jgi:catechol 2,3-dioxygenase-like lactoylglutathione lyase family enzyme
VEQRLSLITLGVADVAEAAGFYERLGWRVGNDFEAQGVAFFQAGGMVVALWSREELAGDSTVADPGGWGGVTLAHNVRSALEVDRVLDQAQAAGAAIARAPARTPWGGYTGVFTDPDGHPWEVAYNPGFELPDDGSLNIPPPDDTPPS